VSVKLFAAGVFFLFVVFLLPASNVTAQTSAAAVAFGNRHAVALRTNGEVLTWGENVYCQLGRTSGNSRRTPVVVMRNAKEIAAASDHTLVLTIDGKVYGWGINAEGPLGTGNTNDNVKDRRWWSRLRVRQSRTSRPVTASASR